MSKFVRFFALATSFFILSTGVATALPATTSWTNAGLQTVVSASGKLTVSTDGCGDRTTGICNLSVEKPAGAVVSGAYLVLASGFNFTGVPTRTTLEGTTVTFTHKAYEDRNPTFDFTNHLADVTDIVKPVIDAAPTGVSQVSIDYHLDFGSGSNFSGAALTVIFDDPNASNGTVIMNFGAMVSSGDCSTFNFPAIVASNVGASTLSVGIGWSSGGGDQISTISAAANGRSSVVIANRAGGIEDGNNITVGGVGDTSANPTLGNFASDDEFYRVDQLLSDGDTSLEICSVNGSADDNLFQSVLYLSGVIVAGSTPVGSATTPVTTPAQPAQPAQPATPAQTTTTTTVAAPALAKTGNGTHKELMLATLLFTFGLGLTFVSSKARKVRG